MMTFAYYKTDQLTTDGLAGKSYTYDLNGNRTGTATTGPGNEITSLVSVR